MNKKHSILIVIMIFCLSAITFAAQEGMTSYSAIIQAYNQGTEYFKGLADSTYVPTIQTHKEELLGRKEAIESSYVPILMNVIAGILGFSSLGMGYYAFQGAGASQDLFKQIPKVNLFENTYNMGLDFFGHIKYSLKNAMGLKNNIVSQAQNKVTQYALQSPEQQKIIEAGVAAVPLGAGSLISAALSLYLFKKAAGYKEELAQIEEAIQRDDEMLKILGN